MHTQESFNALVDEIMALGYDEESAADYAARIGDTPVSDGNGNTLVLDDHNQVIATLRLKFFC